MSYLIISLSMETPPYSIITFITNFHCENVLVSNNFFPRPFRWKHLHIQLSFLPSIFTARTYFYLNTFQGWMGTCPGSPCVKHVYRAPSERQAFIPRRALDGIFVCHRDSLILLRAGMKRPNRALNSILMCQRNGLTLPRGI